MTLRDAAQAALDALENWRDPTNELWGSDEAVYDAISALRSALAAPPESQQEPKPVAWMTQTDDGPVLVAADAHAHIGKYDRPSYTPLTDDEIAALVCGIFAERNYWVKFARSVESAVLHKLGIVT